MHCEFTRILLLFICTSTSLIAGLGQHDFSDAGYALGKADSKIDREEDEVQKPHVAARPGAHVEEGGPAGDNKRPPDSDTRSVVQMPDRIETQPTKVIHTSEIQIETVIVDHIREHHLAEGHPPVYVDKYIVRKSVGI